MIKRNGQTVLEFTVLIIVVISALIVMSTYVKRGFQGRWKQSVDDFGDQYDPNAVNAIVNYSTTSQSSTVVQAVPLVDPVTGQTTYATDRTDSTTSSETRTGNVFVAK